MNNELFRQLHDYCQKLTPKVKRNQIIEKTKELAGGALVRTVKTSLDTSVTRGYFLSADNVEHEFVKQNGRNVIVLARGLNECWERFVNVKEALHLLDEGSDLSDTEGKFEQLLSDFSSPVVRQAPQTVSDLACIWGALACFCPEKSRLEFKDLLEKQQIDIYAIALELKIPEHYVPLLFRPNYLEIVEYLRSDQ